MAQQINRLSARSVQTITTPGRHADGGGLYLVVDKSGARRWVYLYREKGRLREMGLGGVLAVPLARARKLAANAREIRAGGQSPIEARRRVRPDQTFGAVADEFLATKAVEFRNDKHLAQWTMTLTEYAAQLRPKPVQEITTEDVLAVLKPHWTERPETASRLRGRIERVLDAAKAKGLRSGENPARWRGHLDHLLPARQKLTRGHHAALPFADVPAFVARLRSRSSMAGLALEFAILTAARSGEVLGALWSELDLDQRVWTVPAYRMKAGREHRVPLADRAAEILAALSGARTGELVFPGQKPGRPLSPMAMEMLLRRMQVEVTVHGFRSSFRDWVGERTDFAREVAEAALAHSVGDATERAYRRGDALEKRRELMNEWGRYLGS